MELVFLNFLIAYLYITYQQGVGGTVASWLVRLSPDRAVRVRALAGNICCVLGQDTLLSQCLSPPWSINGYWQIVGENLTNCWGVTCNGLAYRLGGVEILLATSCYRNQDNLSSGPMSQLAQKASLSARTYEISE